MIQVSLIFDFFNIKIRINPTSNAFKYHSCASPIKNTVLNHFKSTPSILLLLSINLLGKSTTDQTKYIFNVFNR